MFEALRRWWKLNAERRVELAAKADAESIALLQSSMRQQRTAYDLRRQLLATAALQKVADGQ